MAHAVPSVCFCQFFLLHNERMKNAKSKPNFKWILTKTNEIQMFIMWCCSADRCFAWHCWRNHISITRQQCDRSVIRSHVRAWYASLYFESATKFCFVVAVVVVIDKDDVTSNCFQLSWKYKTLDYWTSQVILLSRFNCRWTNHNYRLNFEWISNQKPTNKHTC